MKSEKKTAILLFALLQLLGGELAAQGELNFNVVTIDHPNPQVGAVFGFAVAGLGDVNGDGVPDLVAAAVGQDVGSIVNQGQLYVFSGADWGLVHIIDHPQPQSNASFGFNLVGLADLNDDAVPDLLVTAQHQIVGGNTDQGQVYIFSGTDGSLVRILDHPNPQARAEFGRSVAGLGDVNGDAHGDFAVAAPLQDVGGVADQGQVYVFSGADGSLLRTLNLPGAPRRAFFGLQNGCAGRCHRGRYHRPLSAVPDRIVHFRRGRWQPGAHH